jgi:hypothetical protein
MVKVESAWVNSVMSSVLLPVPNPYATNDLIYTGPGRQMIVSKLDRIRLRLDFLRPASSVERSPPRFSQKIKARDPEKKGINFLINNNVDASSAAAPAGRSRWRDDQIDPTTGDCRRLPNPGSVAAETVDIGVVSRQT